ncbi:MAG: hypothetical protein JW866_06310 [Ignavibacteriales bacterium]|nr:hypothetical protein [Ignavibacteriales bacterium]
MIEKIKLRNRLAKKCAQKISHVASKIDKEDNLEDDHELISDLRWIDTSTKILENSNFIIVKNSTITLFIFLLSFIVISILALVKKTNISISLQTTCNSVTLDLSEELRLSENIVSNNVIAKNLSAIISPELDINFVNNRNDFDLEIKADKVYLEKLNFEKDGTIILTSKSGNVEFMFLNNRLEGEISMLGDSYASIIGLKDKLIKKSFNIPEYIKIISDNIVKNVTQLRLRNPEKFNLDNLKIRNLNFLQPINSTDKNNLFTSTITHGNIIVYDTPLNISIQQNEYIDLELKEIKSLEIKYENGLSVFFEGKVKKLSVGHRGFEKNMKPSLLKYLYHNHSLVLFWSGLIFIMSALGGIKSLLLKL